MSAYPLFNSICIETAALCNRSCVFCPNHQKDRPDEQMPLDLIWKMRDELGALKYNGRISFYIYNEPLRDERLCSIGASYGQHVPRARLMLNTNGDYIKSERDIQQLLDAGFRQFSINVYSAADGCGDPKKEAKGVEVAKRRHAQLQKWLDKLGLEDGGTAYGAIGKGKVSVRIEAKYGVTKETKKLGSQFELQNRSGNIPWFKSTAKTLDAMCVRPFRILNINWRGQAILCCNDYHGISNFGNVRTNTLVEIWNSAGFYEVRKKLLAKDRRMPLCDTCDYKGGAYKHMVNPV